MHWKSSALHTAIATCLINLSLLSVPATGQITKIGNNTGGLGAAHGVPTGDFLQFDDFFGRAVDSLGDFDGDGHTDIVIGSPGRESIWILLLDANSNVTECFEFGGFTTMGDGFGTSVACIGDLDGNGYPDIAVGAPDFDHSTGGPDSGSVWILQFRLVFQSSTPVITLKSQSLIDHDSLSSGLSAGDEFGKSVIAIGTASHCGANTDVTLVVGADRDDTAEVDAGCIYVLCVDLSTSGHVLSDAKFVADTLSAGDFFGHSLASFGDLISSDTDSNLDIAVGASGADTGGSSSGNQGRVYILGLDDQNSSITKDHETQIDFLACSHTVKASLGSSLAVLDDLDSDGVKDLAVGAKGGGCCGGANGFSGEVFVLHLKESTGRAMVDSEMKLDLTGVGLDDADRFGNAIATFLKSGSTFEFIIGAPRDDGVSGECEDKNFGAVWILDNPMEVTSCCP